jgi:selenocysteine lyase/cysteine desulfurase
MDGETLARVTDISRPLVAREHFSASLPPGALHFTAHGHHPRLDVTRHATLECWDDAARLQGAKWGKFFREVVPEAQGHIASVLGIAAPDRIAFAGATHEFVARLLTCFDPARPIRVLTSDCEFASFDRQLRRAMERGTIDATIVPVLPDADFEERFAQTAESGSFDLVFLSEVMFNRGYLVDGLAALCRRLKATGAEVVVDGYHAFMALPEDFAGAGEDCFYMAGAAKYAMAGEGACFMSLPRGCDLKPEDTGWFADFLNRGAVGAGPVRYSDDGWRFAGSVIDPAGLYRFNAAMRLLGGLGVSVADIHAHVRALQALFLRALAEIGHPVISTETLTVSEPTRRGNFIAFEHDDAAGLADRLATEGIKADARGRIIRFGFGCYHSGGDIVRMVDILHDLARNRLQ